MEVKKKRVLSQMVIHTFMFVSGLEYAIIFPTIWEYLQSLGVDKEQTYWLGLVISAMTMTDMISGLIIGRVVDIYTNTRTLVLFLNLFQVGGGIIYCVARSPVILFVGRLLSGCGKSISVAFLADLCRSTSKSERTPVLLILNISQQIGMVLGPAMNLLLRHLDIHVTHSLSITKLNSPGLVMAGLWSIVSIMVLLFYSDLVKLASEELISDQLENQGVSNETMENYNLYSDGSDSVQSFRRLSIHSEVDEEVVDNEDLEQSIEKDHNNAIDTDLNNAYVEDHTNDKVYKNPYDKGQIEINYDEQLEIEAAGPHLPEILSPPPGISGPGTSHILGIPAIDCFRATSRGGSGFSIGPGPDSSSQGSDYGSTDQIVPNSYVSELRYSDTFNQRRASWDIRVDPIRLLRRSKRKSEKYIIEAERLIAHDESSYTSIDASYRTNFSSRNVSVAQSEFSASITSESIGWSEYKEHMFKIEIFILIFIRFIVLFCQTSLEAIVPPIMNTIFQYDDSANSYLYLAAGLEFIVVFGILTLLSRRQTDRSLVIIGLILSLVALIWHSCTIPNFTVGDRSQVKYFGIGAFLQLLGCPVVSEIGLALFSKLVPEHVQGFAHGVRRFFSQLAVLLGPLWGASTLTLPLLLTLLPLGLQVGGTILFIIWYSKMLPSSSDSLDENTPLLS